MIKKRDNRITVAQFIATICIVVLHSGICNGWGLKQLVEYRQIVQFEKMINHICQMAVPMFFFFSGYLMYLNYKPEQYFRKLKSRIRSLVVPYIIWNTVATIYFVLLTNIPIIASKMNQPKKEINFGLIREIVMSENTPLWYIRNLLVLTIASVLLYRILRIQWLALLTICIVSVVAVILDLNYYSILYWLPMYCIGSYIAIHYKNIPQHVVFVGPLLLVSMIVTYFKEDMMYIYRLVSSFSVPVFLCRIIKIDTIIAWYMNITLYIYCTHFLLISTFQKLWKIVFGVSVISAWLCYLCTPMLVLSILFISAYFWKKYLPSSWAIVTGGRS